MDCFPVHRELVHLPRLEHVMGLRALTAAEGFPFSLSSM